MHTVTVSVTHEGQTSAGLVEPPYPTGSVLGAYDNKFEFYVVGENSKSANFTSQIPEKLGNDASLSVSLDSGSNNNVSWAYKTAVMPGFILSQENSASTDFTFAYDTNHFLKTHPAESCKEEMVLTPSP